MPLHWYAPAFLCLEEIRRGAPAPKPRGQEEDAARRQEERVLHLPRPRPLDASDRSTLGRRGAFIIPSSVAQPKRRKQWLGQSPGQACAQGPDSREEESSEREE